MSIIVVCSEYAEAVQTLSNAVAQLKLVQEHYHELMSDLAVSGIVSSETGLSFDSLKAEADSALNGTWETLNSLSDEVGSFVDEITEIDSLTL